MNKLKQFAAANPRTAFLAIALLLAFIIYQPVMFHDRLIGLDDPVVVKPLSEIKSWSDYWSRFAAGQIMDRQPVRDLTFKLNYLAEDVFGFAGFQLVNVIIWVGITFLLRSILILVGCSQLTASILALGYLVHPNFVGTVAWTTARKHLLAGLFTLSATYLLMKWNRIKAASEFSGKEIGTLALLYTLACFSQPIVILWPAFALIYILSNGNLGNWKSPRIIATAVGLGSLGIFCAFVNQSYYVNLYQSGLYEGAAQKYVAESFDTTGWKFLAFGRYVAQSALPFWPNVWDHNPEHFANFVGFAVAAILLISVHLLKLWRVALPWLSLFLLTLTPVLARMTNVFASDNYLVTASIGIFVTLGLIISSTRLNLSRVRTFSLGAALLVIVICSFTSRSIASAWTNDYQLWKMANELEETAKNSKEYAKELLIAGKPVEATPLALSAFDRARHLSEVSLVTGKAIFTNPQLSVNEKFRLLAERPSPWTNYFLAVMYAERGNFNEAWKAISAFIPSRDLNQDAEVIAAEALFFCKKAAGAGCENILPQMKSVLGSRPWNESRYASRLRELGF